MEEILVDVRDCGDEWEKVWTEGGEFGDGEGVYVDGGYC